MKTYDEILKSMEEEYRRLSGNEPRDASDIGIRLKVLAGEIYSLYASVEWLKTQIYPQTAQGQYLERHCGERGIRRAEALKAVGRLEFSRGEALDYDLIIPEGTVCASDSSLEYVTTEIGRILKGTLSVSIPAAAVSGGREYNCGKNVVNTLLTSVAGVEKVTNPQVFTGGADRETDEQLRARLLESYDALPDGANKAYYRQLAMAHEGITSAAVAGDSGVVKIYLWGNGAPPEAGAVSAVAAEAAEKRELNVRVEAAAATPKELTYMVYVKPKPGVSMQAASTYVNSAVEAYFENKKVGDPVLKSDLGRFILENAPVEDYMIPSAIADHPGDPSVKPVLGILNILELS